MQYYPETGSLRRELYPKHLEFFAAGSKYRERLMLAANRVGKTEGVGGYELVCHLTGRYPTWWQGRRFDRPIKVWVCGDTSKTIREILQDKLLGPIGSWGTGLVPGDTVQRIVRATGVPDTVDSVFVSHAAGGTSRLVFKSYDQRRESFQGTEQDVIWLDEEPPLDVYTECLTRTMTNNGMIMLTFTPLMGISEVVKSFLPSGKLEAGESGGPGRYIVMATWDDVPHLDQAAKDELYAKYPPHQRDARSKGIPALGSGVIYPVPESEISVTPFAIPDYWPRAFGLDTDMGAGYTAAVWGALNRDTQTLYIYDCYKGERSEIAIHVDAVRSRGSWIPGVGDAAAVLLTAHDSQQIISLYRKAGIDLNLADKSVEAGIQRTWELLAFQRLKVFSSCDKWFQEYRLYRRDEDGRIVKKDDHLMDATRYLVMSGLDRIKTKPAPPPEVQPYIAEVGTTGMGWMR